MFEEVDDQELAEEGEVEVQCTLFCELHILCLRPHQAPPSRLIIHIACLLFLYLYSNFFSLFWLILSILQADSLNFAILDHYFIITH